jgi:hypothetical protein
VGGEDRARRADVPGGGQAGDAEEQIADAEGADEHPGARGTRVAPDERRPGDRGRRDEQPGAEGHAARGERARGDPDRVAHSATTLTLGPDEGAGVASAGMMSSASRSAKKPRA